jgi:NADH-quinone oxidoreductase subunit N
VLASAIGLVYYLKLVKVMFFDDPVEAFDPVGGMGSKTILVIASVVALFFIVAASPVISAADAAAKALIP